MAFELYTPSMLERGPRRYYYIIIHDTSCQWPNYDMYKIDKNTFQAGPMRARFKAEMHWYETPYHFICERIGQNYQTVLGRPLQYASFDAFPDINRGICEHSIHVCLMCNYNVLGQTSQLYQQLCYRVLCPMMKAYRISRKRIFLHGELSDEHPDCPVYRFSKSAMYAYMAKYLQGTPG